MSVWLRDGVALTETYCSCAPCRLMQHWDCIHSLLADNKGPKEHRPLTQAAWLLLPALWQLPLQQPPLQQLSVAHVPAGTCGV